MKVLNVLQFRNVCNESRSLRYEKLVPEDVVANLMPDARYLVRPMLLGINGHAPAGSTSVRCRCLVRIRGYADPYEFILDIRSETYNSLPNEGDGR